MRMTRDRRAAVLVAVGYLLGYLLVFVHFAAEHHAVCAEHGVAHHAELSEPSATPLASGFHAAPGSVDDHCHLLNAVRDQAAGEVAAPDLHVPSAQAAEDNVRNALRSVRTGGAVWRYAPKTSPPSPA